MSYYYLEVTRGIEKGRRYLVEEGNSSIGRNSENTIVLPGTEKSVSSHHAILYRFPDKITIQDLQSTNGTFINDEKIDEAELNENDELGLGKRGPRLRLIISETELSTHFSGSPQGNEAGEAALKTMDDESNQPFPPSSPVSPLDDRTESTEKDTVEAQIQSSRSRAPLGAPEGTNMTMEMEQKLLRKKLDSRDMQNLVKDGERIERIAMRGNVSGTQIHMLRNVHGMHKKTNRNWLFISGGIAFVSLIIITFFAVRAYQYQAAFKEAKSLKEELAEYENKIALLRASGNRQELRRLIKELEQKQSSFSNKKSLLHEEDLGKFYSDPLEKKIDEILMRFGETDYHIPQNMIDRIRHHIEIYSGRMKPTIAKYMKRRKKYFPMIREIFKKNNLPLELAYISMLESGFNPLALSHAGARGIWQFMPHTARRFGLKVNNTVDERTDPLKATYAAAKYFKVLIALFGSGESMMLAMAAYNAGERRVSGALMKIDDPMRNRDFWYIYRMGYLAEETNEYIPRMMALMILTENQAEYGFGAQGQKGIEEENESEEILEEDDFLDIEF